MRLLRALLCRASPAPLPSALYVLGRSAERVVSVLRPCLDDALAPERLPALRESVRRRRVADVDVEALVNDQRRLARLGAEKAELARRRAEIAARGAELRRHSPPAAADEQTRLRRDGAAVKERLRALQEPLWTLEEAVLPRLARLPNAVHTLTPAEDEFEPVPAPAAAEPVPLPAPAPPFGHVEPSDVSPGAYYLHGAAAACELALVDYVCGGLAAAGFQRVSCPDTVKSLVAEGCGLAFAEPARVARLAACHEGTADSPLGLHLVGGASLPAVCALLAKSRQPAAAVPLRLFAAGRLYGPPAGPAPAAPPLLAPPQSSAVRHLTAGSAADAAAAFDASLRLLAGLVAPLGPACRLRRVAAPDLARSESRRTELQLRVPRLGRHVTVAHVAQHGDYISRRLHMAYAEPGETECRLLHVVEGAAVLAPSVLEALMDGKPGQLSLSHCPAVLQPFMYSV